MPLRNARPFNCFFIVFLYLILFCHFSRSLESRGWLIQYLYPSLHTGLLRRQNKDRSKEVNNNQSSLLSEASVEVLDSLPSQFLRHQICKITLYWNHHLSPPTQGLEIIFSVWQLSQGSVSSYLTLQYINQQCQSLLQTSLAEETTSHSSITGLHYKDNRLHHRLARVDWVFGFVYLCLKNCPWNKF